jgi:uncharacterized cupin superfamily protein
MVSMAEVIITQLSEQEILEKKIRNWPIWSKEISRFDWYYDSEEACLILEGEIMIEAGNEKYQIRPGDFVIFKKGLKCVWNVLKPVRKHYQFR